MLDDAVLLHGVTKSFPLHGGGTLDVLDVERLSIPAGGLTALTGRSGSGKTTLLNLIAGISLPTSGTVAVGDTDVCGAPRGGTRPFPRAAHRIRLPDVHLLSALSALENVMLAMMFSRAVPRSAQRRRAADVLGRLGLGARLSTGLSSSRAGSSSASPSPARSRTIRR